MIVRWLRNWRRARLLDEPFPREWERHLARNVSHFPRLSPAQQQQVRDGVRILVGDKRWEGANKFPINDEIKVTIAAMATLPLLGMDHDYYARVKSIVVYGGTFEVPDRDEFGEIDDTFPAFLADGLASEDGAVAISWPRAIAEGRDPEAEGNAVIHEFAHQLDFLDGVTNGTPPLLSDDDARRWGRVMQAAFDRHLSDLKRGGKTFFTEHAGDNEAEFFADASEVFFCVPHELEHEEPEVFELLLAYYRVDPRPWFPSA